MAVFDFFAFQLSIAKEIFLADCPLEFFSCKSDLYHKLQNTWDWIGLALLFGIIEGVFALTPVEVCRFAVKIGTMIGHWINEAIRRRVFRTAGLYIVGSWVLIQVLDVVFEAWGIPDTAMRYVILAVMVGFPLALVFGWKYDITSKGIVRTETAEGGAKEKLGSLDYLVLSALLVVAGVVIYRAAGFTLQEFGKVENPTAIEQQNLNEGVPDDNTVAVMPFVNMSDDPGNAYFSDGIAEELLNSLARVHGLGVTARTSAFALRDLDLDIREIARRLTVANVVEGSVRKAGNRVRITAQLIRAEDGYHLWSETYDRDLDDIFAIQSEVADLIASALVPQLTPGDRERLSIGSTSNVEALDEFLRGQALMETRVASNLEASLEHFRRAVSLDPEYALAYLAIAKTYAHLRHYGGLTPAQMVEAGLEYVEKAVELVPGLGEVYSTLANYRWEQGNPDEALELSQKSIELDPLNADSLRFHARLLRQQFQRFPEAVELTRKAVQLDPLSPIAHVNYGTAMMANGDPAAAIEEYNKALVLNPGLPVAFNSMAFALDRLGQMGKRAWALKRSVDLNPDSWQNNNMYASALLKLGLNEEAERASRLTIDVSSESGHPFFTLFESLLRQDRIEEARQVQVQLLAKVDVSYLKLQMELYLLAAEQAPVAAYQSFMKSLDFQALVESAVEQTDVQSAIYLSFLANKAGSEESISKLLSMVENAAGSLELSQGWEIRVSAKILNQETDAAIDYLEKLESVGSFKDSGMGIYHDPILNLLEGHPRYDAFRQRMLDIVESSLAEYQANLDTELPADWVEVSGSEQ